MKIQSLLEKAKNIPCDKRKVNTEVIPEELEVYVAYLNGEINGTQAAAVIGVNNRNVATYAGMAIRRAIANGQVKLVMKP